MALTNQQLVAALYIAVYNRAPDQAGLGFWTAQLDAGVSLEAVATGITQHEMFTSQPYTTPNLFTNTFGPVTTGFFEGLYWRGNLAANPLGVVLAEFVQRVLGVDATTLHNGVQIPAFEIQNIPVFQQTLMNRIEAALTFANALGAVSNMAPGTVISSKDSLLADPAYQASIAAVAGVSADPVSLAAVKSDIAAAVAAGSPASALVSKTLTLTAGTDMLTSSLSNDTFNALAMQDASGITVNTLQTGDVLKGGGGVDTLNAVLVSTAYVAPTLSGIELLNLRFSDAGTLDLANSTGITTINVSGNSAAATINSVGAATDFMVRNQTLSVASTTFNGSTSMGTTTFVNSAPTLGLNLNLDHVGSATSTSSVTLNNAVATALKLTTANSYSTLSGLSAVKTLALSLTGTNKLVLDQTLLNSITTLKTTYTTYSNSGDIVEFVGAFTALTTLDAFVNGGIKITLGNAVRSVSTSDSDDFITFTGSLAANTVIDLRGGNNTVILEAAPQAGAVIRVNDLGQIAGVDTLGMRAVDYVQMVNTFSAVFLERIKFFDVLLLTDSRGLADGLTIDASKLQNVTAVTLAGVATGSAASVTQLSANATVTLKGDLVQNNGLLTLALKDASGGADVLNLVLNESGALSSGSITGVAPITINAASVETLNVTTAVTSSLAGVTDAKAAYTLSLADSALTVLKLAGTQSITYRADALSTKLAAVDASALTASVSLNLSAVASTSATVKVTGTALADTFTLTNNAVVTGGLGADTFIMGAASNAQSYSTITDASKGDIIAFSATPVGYQSAKLSLAETAAFLDYLNLATASTVVGKVTWFQAAGDTYVVQDNSTASTFQNGLDAVIKLSGLVDLSAASFNASTASLTV